MEVDEMKRIMRVLTLPIDEKFGTSSNNLYEFFISNFKLTNIIEENNTEVNFENFRNTLLLN